MTEAGKGNGGGNGYRLKWDGTINLGTLLHLLVLTATLTLAYFGMQQRLAGMELQQGTILQRIGGVENKTEDAARRNQRIELYLQSRDARYWKQVREFENAMPAATPAPSTTHPDKPPEQWRRPQ